MSFVLQDLQNLVFQQSINPFKLIFFYSWFFLTMNIDNIIYVVLNI